MQSFLWYDLETFGRDPRRTRIAQFAGLRTDAELNPVEDPVVLYARPADDLLPSPGATLVTGLTPQRCLREGEIEADVVARIHEQMARPGTCVAGYNSLRFDDEFVRCALYRNFHDPYAREWKDGNSRWDLLDLMRLAYALRPEGIEWPTRDEGLPSFRLEDLAAANDIVHSRAHDALSDVEATVGLARRVKQAQPKLFDYYFGLRDKRRAAALLDYARMTPVLHVSGRFAPARRCAAIVVPLAVHPEVGNRIICLDLGTDPTELLTAEPQAIADRLFVRSADLPEGVARFALKEVHLNRSPALVAWNHLREDDFVRLCIDIGDIERRIAAVRAAEGLAERVRQAFAIGRGAREPADADAALYDGFPDERDRRLFTVVRATPPDRLAELETRFVDPRYATLLFRYRARNWPDTLSPAERARWDDYRRLRLSDDTLSEYSFDSYAAEIAELRALHPEPGPAHALLDALEDWGRRLQESL